MSAGLMKPKYDTNNLPYTQHSPCSGIDHRFFTYFGAVCWSWNTADKTCMHCILFRPVLLSQRPQRSLEVNVWKLMLILLLQYNTITEHYECHITTAMICHTCAFDGNDCVFPVFFCKNCICIISQVSASYTSHNLLCSFPGIPTCQWCYVDTICLYKIDKLNLYCLVFSVVVLFRRLSHLWMKKTATNQINNN